MRLVPFVLIRRRVAFACCLGALVFLAHGVTWAGLVGSKHDFTASPGAADLAPGGGCSACHIPHFGEIGNVIWSRSLTEEKADFKQLSNPNYAPGYTLLCYDCHDNHATSAIDGADNDPADNLFDSARLPQDVAFDDDMKTTVPRDGLNTTEAPPKPGYYENIPSGSVGGASSYVSGHFFQQDTGGTGEMKAGDKLPCSDCHDPHSNANQAFIRQDLGGKTLTDKRASTNMAYTYSEFPAGRDDQVSREFCIACHGTSEQSTKKAVPFNDVNPAYGNGTIVAPDSANAKLIPAHKDGNATACTKCHKHNGISISCQDCHGFPPLRTIAEAGGGSNNFDKTLRNDVENYSGGAGAHRRHKDALGDTIFQCEICHGPNAGSAPWHKQGNILIPDGSAINIMGLDTYWAPSGYPGTITPAYDGSGNGPSPGDASYVFSSMGGGQRRCSGVACHGNPLVSETAELNWDDNMIDGDAPEQLPFKAREIQICKWCHDASPSTIDGGATYAPNVMGNGLATVAGFGAEVNGHGVGLAGAVKAAYDKDAVNDAAGAAGAGKDCIACHEATYAAGAAVRKHFSAIFPPAPSNLRDEKRLRDTINSVGITNATVYPTGPDQACAACHQNGVNTAVDGLDQSHHGNPAVAGYTPLEGDFTRACRQCHDVHGSNFNGAGRNLYMVGKWIDVNGDRIPNAADGAYVDSNATTELAAITSGGGPANDNPVVFTSTSGADSFDENDGAYNAADDTDDICATCHDNATRGGDHSGSTAGVGDLRGQNCMTCHDHDYDDVSTTANAFMPSGCSGCHGRSSADGNDSQGEQAYKGQYWPDGLNAPTDKLYADSDPGAHNRHVQGLALRLYGETLAQVVTDTGTTSFAKQTAICAFCHPNPGKPLGAEAHTIDNATRPGADGRVDVFGGTGADLDSGSGTVPDWFKKYVPNAGLLAASADDTTTNTPNGYVYATLSCGAGGATADTNLTCHNQAPTPTVAVNWNAPVPDTGTAPIWTPAGATCSNLSCHATSTYTIAHTTHVGGTPKSYACTECHANNAANLQHGNGEVDMKWDNAGSLEFAHGGDGFYNKDNTAAPTTPSAGDTAFGYKSGGATPTDATYARSCYRVYCHGGDNNATYTPDWGGSGNTPNVMSPVWNADPTNITSLVCTTCHATAPPTGRHTAHDTNNAWVPNECGECHLANTNKTSMAGYAVTHANGSPTMAATVTYTPPTCGGVGMCHLVNAATGDWIDTDPLACTDCHSGTYFGTQPTSGLHYDGSITSAMAHDVQFPASQAELPPALPTNATGTCTHCHLSTGPSSSHKTGSAGAVPPTQNSTETTYSFNTAYIPNVPAGSGYVNASYPAATSCQALCHSDYRVSTATGALDPGGLWRRRWVGVEDAKPVDTNNPGDAVCKNCHGDFTNGWNLSVVDANTSTTTHTNPYDQGGGNPDRMSAHSVCQTCHGWGHVNYSATWGDAAKPSHGDGSITMNGPSPSTGAAYIDSGANAGGCAKACHLPSFVLNTNSGWPANFGDFGSGVCENCHNGRSDKPYALAPNVMGDGTSLTGTAATTPKPFDDGVYGFNVNGHGADGSADHNPVGLNPNKACTECHSLLPHHLDGVLDGVGGRGNAIRHENNYHLRTDGSYPFIAASSSNDWDVQLAFDTACWMRCHEPINNFNDMRHNMDPVFHPVKNLNTTPGAVRFGDKKTVLNGESIGYPVDSDLSTRAATAEDDFVTCATCHNAHGTAVDEPAKNTNRMVRDMFYDQSTLCLFCHK